jgi:hypothetical protein
MLKYKNNITTGVSLMSHKQQTLEHALEDDDYALIVGKDGQLKGIWIPDAIKNKEQFPREIQKLCVEYFNLDPNADDDIFPVTVH